MSITSLFFSVLAVAMAGLGLAGGIVKAIDGADNDRGYSQVIIGVVICIICLFHALVEIYQMQWVKKYFTFLTSTWWGKGILITMYGLLILDRPKYTFTFVAGIILIVAGIVYGLLAFTKVDKPDAII
ncbi:hypothetical protein H696_01329 [Fonticula alba]|uniref:COPI associated protein n=1 Tax=Fonticula alba TaxID=691883 RepID=A0A058ZBZ2_FONAL|nr:hypothetical protein H696_01329 [Fonticula alba]KCV71919.1 hypothetical protein H696_01329 [Fonticula alba]|eukprot:XP_009493497.1 hypothetical protein H696_01329 [Fonticula alba]